MNREEYDVIDNKGSRHFWFAQRRRILEHLINKYNLKESTVLDTGTGTGIDLDLFSNAIGVDIDTYGLMYALKQGKPLINCNAQALPVKSGSIDCIISMDLLGSMGLKAEKVFDEYFRVLKAGGIVIMNLPALQFMYSGHDIAVGNARRFNRPMVKRMTGTGRFKLEEIFYWNSLLLPLVMGKRFLINRLTGLNESDVGSVNGLQNSIFNTVMRAEYNAAINGLMPVGLSIMCVARKREV